MLFKVIRPYYIKILYILTIFIGSFLLFLIQPMVSKLILPILGGSPSVWNTSMIYYQIVLLIGYYYAYIIDKKLSFNKQLKLHLFIAIVSFISIPIILHTNLPFDKTTSPVLWLLATLFVSIGLPFFILSSCTPIIQRWFSYTNHPDSSNPYFLYSSSNIGNFIALFSYPFFIEPFIHLANHTFVFSLTYIVFIGLLCICSIVCLKNNNIKLPSKDSSIKYVLFKDKLKWIVYAFVPSSLLVSVTYYISNEIGVFAFLWILPLAIYLLTYAVTFSHHKIDFNILSKLHKLLICLCVFAIYLRFEHHLIIALHLLTFFVVCIVLHKQLANHAPNADKLSLYYLYMSIGGVLGGLFATLLAPFIFTDITEYPLMLIAAFLLHPSYANLFNKFNINNLSIPILLLSFVMAEYQTNEVIYSSRNFFGISKVIKKEDTNYLYIGRLIHGMQSSSISVQDNTKEYMQSLSEIIQQLSINKINRIGIFGLGVGMSSCLFAKDQYVDFYEINPDVKAIAENDKFFSYIKDCKPQVDIIVSDGRSGIVKKPNNHYDLLVINSYTAGPIPGHLITTEAFDLYMQKINDDGVLLIYLNSKDRNLAEKLSANGKRIGAAVIQRKIRYKDQELSFLAITKNASKHLQYKFWYKVNPTNKNYLTDNYTYFLY